MVDPLDRRVLEQDREQYEQSTKAARERRDKERAVEAERQYQSELLQYEKDKTAYEKEVADAEAEYQKELAEYNKIKDEVERQIAIQKKQEEDRKIINQKYDTKIADLEAEKQRQLNAAHQRYWGHDRALGKSRSQFNSEQNRIKRQFNSKINAVKEEKRLSVGVFEFSIAYPNAPISQTDLRTFRESPSKSLGQIYEKRTQAREAKAEYSRRGSIKSAQSAAIKMRDIYARDTSQLSNITGYGLEQGKTRAEAIKPTLNIITGKIAVQPRRPLINVNTGQSIMGGQKASPATTITRTESYREKPSEPVLVRTVTREIPERKASKGVPTLANPVAFVRGLDRQDVTASGKPSKPIQGLPGSQVVYSFQNISDVREPSALALLEFQSQLKTTTAPSASVYKGILKERGLPETILSKRIIETYSAKPTREYKSLAEAYGLPEAKGRKGIIKKDGKTIFDLETGEGSIRVGRLLGYQYSKPVMVNELGEGVQGAPAPIWTIPDAFGNPRKDASGNVIQLKSEEKASTLAQRIAEKPSDLTLFTIQGEKKLQVIPPKKTGLSLEIERGHKQLVQDAEWLQKNPKSKNLLLAAYQTVAPIGLAAGISMGEAMAFGVNYAEQTYAPFLAEKLGLKVKKVAPIEIEGVSSGVTVLPYQFEKERFDYSWKEWASRQAKSVERFGVPVYVGGLVFDYGGLKSAPQQLKVGGQVAVKTVPKLIERIKSPINKRLAEKTESMVDAEPRISFPSKRWDAPTEKIGVKIPAKRKPVILKMIKNDQGFPNRSLSNIHKGTSPNMPQIKTSEYKIQPQIKRDIQRARDIFYPKIEPTPPSRIKGSWRGFIGGKVTKTKIIIKDLVPKPKVPEFVRKDLKMPERTISPKHKGTRSNLPDLGRPRTEKGSWRGFIKGKFAREKNTTLAKQIKPPKEKVGYAPMRFVEPKKLKGFKYFAAQEVATNKYKLPTIEKFTKTDISFGVGTGKIEIRQPLGTYQRVSKLKTFDIKKAFPFEREYPGFKKSKILLGKSTARKMIPQPKGKQIAPPKPVELDAFPAKKSKAKLGKNIFREDQARETQQFLDSLKSEKTMSREFTSEFPKERESIIGLSKKYFAKKSITSKARIPELRKEFPTKQNIETTIKKLPGGKRPTDIIKGMVKEGEGRKERIDWMRGKKKLELDERTVSIFKIPYKETELDKIFAELGKKQKVTAKKTTYRTPETPSRKEPLKKIKGDEIKSGRQILIMKPLKMKKILSQPASEIKKSSVNESQIKPKDSSNVIIPPIIKERKKKPYLQEAQTQQVYEIPLYAQRPQFTTKQTSIITPRLDTPQMVAEKLSFATVQPQKLSSPQKIAQQPKYREASRLKSPQRTMFVQKPKQVQRQPQRILQPAPQKIPTRLAQPPAFRQPTRLKQPQLLRTVPHPRGQRVIPIGLLPKEPTPYKQKKSSPKEKADFLGNVPESQIEGVFGKRSETVYGQKRIARLLKGDVRVIAGKPRTERRKKEKFDVLGFSKKKKKKTSFW